MLATYFVDTTLDTDSGICVADNPGGNIGCSIRSAIDAASQNPGADTIRIPDGNYVLSTSFGSLDVFDSADLSFIGNAAIPAAVVIDGVNETRVFDMFVVGPAYTVSFEGMTIQNGIARDASGGGGINSGLVDLRLNRMVVQNNQAAISYLSTPNSGGGIQASGNVTITNSVIRNNTATRNGGAIDFGAFENRTLSISDSTISGNTTGDTSLGFGYGGGVFVGGSGSYATVQLNRVTIDGNTAGDSGGGFYHSGGAFTSTLSTFSNNVALGGDSGGGGLYVLGNGPSSAAFNVLGGTFSSNRAVSGAGGFEAVDVGGTIDGAIFSLNRVTGSGTSFDQGGGAIAIISTSPSNASPVTLSNLLVDQNTAPSAGGIAAVDAKLSIENSSILNNEATGLLIGSAGGIGAVASAAGSTLDIINSSIAGNRAELQAGGIGAIDVNVTVSSSIVESNIARTGRAGGIGLAGQGVINPVLITNAVTIADNQSGGDGGGIGVQAARIDLLNTTISGNRSVSGNGGGLALINATSGSVASFTTVASNQAALGSNVAMQNTILRLQGSLFAAGTGIAVGSSFQSLGNNLDQSGTMGLSGVGDLSGVDPKLRPLADNGGPVPTHAILPGSPAIDAGPTSGPSVDARGISRPLDGDGVGGVAFDIGAFEADFVEPRTLTIRDVLVDEVAGTATVQVQLNVAGPSFAVDFSTQGINATADDDFEQDSGTLSFTGSAGEIRSFVISILDDGVTELDESIFVSLSDLVKSSPADPDVNIFDTAIVTIVDDDVATLVPSLDSVDEDAGTATYTLVLNGDVDESFTVDVSTAVIANGALPGTDVSIVTQRLTFSGFDGETQTLTVSITQDDVVEGDEAFGLVARNIQGDGRAIRFDGGLSSVTISSLDQFVGSGIVAQALDLSVPRGEAYVATETGLQVINTSDPSQLTAVQVYSTSEPVSDVQVIGDVAYLTSGNTLQIVDLGSSSNPRLLGTFTSSNSITDVQVSGSRAYLLESAALGGGLRVVDVADPKNITSLGFFGTSLSSFDDLFVDGEKVYVADPFAGLRVLDASNASSIVELGRFSGIEALSIDVRGATAYVGTSSGLSVIDVSNPAAMSELASIATLDDVTDVEVNESQTTVAIVDFSGLLQILDVTNLGRIRSLGQFTGLDSPFAFEVQEDLVFVADGAGGLRSLSVDSVKLSVASILNDDFATLTVSDVTVDEASGTASVTVTLDKAVQDGFTYQFTTNDGTATQGSDYTATTGTLSSGNLGEQQTITIPILSDNVPEGIETFTVSLFNVVPFGNVSPSSINASDVGTITITEAGIVDLSVSKSDSQDPARPDSNLTYTLLVTNNGTADASGVVAVDQLPAGVTFVSGDVDGNSSRVSVLGNTVTASIGGLEPSESATVTIVVRVGAAASGLLINTATVSSIEVDANPANNTDTETTGVDRITASDDTSDINEDDLVQIINVLGNDNSGPGGPLTIFSVGTAALGNVVIAGGGTRLEYTPNEHAFGRDTFVYTVQSPTGLLASANVTVNIASVNDPPTAVDDSVDANDRSSVTIPISSLLSDDDAGPANEGQSPQFVSASVSSTNGGTISVSGGNLIYTPSTSFTGNVDSFTYTITDGEFTDTATVTINLPPLPNIDLTTSITDSADPVNAGSSLTFTVVVSNQGSDFASNVVSTVFIASAFTILSAEASPSGSVSVSGNTVTATLISLNGGGSATITITAVASDIEGSFSSSAIVSSSDVDLLPTNNSDSELTSIVVPASLFGHVYCDLDGSEDENSGESSAAVRVFLDSDGDRIFDSGERFTFTDSQGDYRFANITETFVTVVAEVPQGCNTIPFDPGIVRSSVGVGDLARSIFDVDIDGDEDLDLLVASDRSNSLAVLVNDGGNFTLREQIPLADRPQSVVAWRGESSSAPPLIAVAGVGTPADGGSLFVFSLGGPVASIKVGNGPIDVAIDDFDLNGQPDVVVGTLRSSDVQVFLNGSNEPIPVAVARLVRSVSTGDVNGDGLPDIVVGGYGYPGDPESELLVLLGDGEGGFDEPIVAGISQQLIATKVAGLTMPTKEMTEEESQDMRVMALSAAGEFKLFTLDGTELIETTMLSVSPGSNAFDLGDFNRDGLTDVAISNQGQQRIDLFVGDGTGRFVEILSLDNVSAPSDLVVADLDNDGQMDDVAVTNLYQNSRIGLPGVPGFFLPSATTIVRLDVSEAPVVIGASSTRVDFVFQSADPAIRFDVSGDGMVSALDALRVINAMARLQGEGEQIGTASRAVTDVNGDGRTSAIDALMIINLLSGHPGGQVALRDLDLLSDNDNEGDRIAAVDVLFAGKLF